MEEERQRRIFELQESLVRGEISRRDFLRYASVLGLSLGAAQALAACTSQATPTSAPEAAAPTSEPAAAEPVAVAQAEPEPEGWGIYNYPYPSGEAMIETYEAKCVGCHLCSYACAMKHWGVMNPELANIRIRKYLLPLPKSIQSVCAQCQEEERECVKACPVDPPLPIFFDEETLHMRIVEEGCLGEKCMQCRDACSAQAIHIYPSVSPIPFVCDLCDTENTGDRKPECVNICPYDALYFKNERNRDMSRIHPDEKADLFAARLYPMVKDSMGYPEWDI